MLSAGERLWFAAETPLVPVNSRQTATAAQIAATAKNGFSRSSSATAKSRKYLMAGFQGRSTWALVATCVKVIQPCCEFQIQIGRVQRTVTAKARYGPGRRK